MEGYTFTAAAKLLQVSRQTIYRHIDKEPDRYTAVTEDGQRRITLAGLALLREKMQRPVTGEPSGDTSGGTPMQQESDSAGQRVRELQDDVTKERHRAELLQVQLDAANARITDLEADKVALRRALDQEQILHRQTQEAAHRQRLGGFFSRLFGKSEHNDDK